jgi:hypothetical protein
MVTGVNQCHYGVLIYLREYFFGGDTSDFKYLIFHIVNTNESSISI